MPATIFSTRYNNVAKTLHWLIALLIITMLALGWTMENVDKGNPYRFQMFQLHKSIGITILLLSLMRLTWRLMHRAPPLPETMPAWEKFAARATHVLFYVFMIGMPLTGWAIVSSSPLNLPTYLFGYIHWPDLPVLPELANKREVSHVFGAIHGWGAYILAALLVLHVGAAVKHHWINRDDVLIRMLPGPVVCLFEKLRGDKMKKKPASLILAALLLFLSLGGTAQANDWEVDYTKSFIGFTGIQGGEGFSGVFSSFKVKIDFDPDNPAKGSISATIDINSASTNDKQRDAMLPLAEWFNTVKFPEATFTCDDIVRTGPDSFIATGMLSIKGLSHTVKLPFTLKPDGDHWLAQGTVRLIRTDYHIGEGQWANESMVRTAVDVTIQIAAKTKT